MPFSVVVGGAKRTSVPFSPALCEMLHCPVCCCLEGTATPAAFALPFLLSHATTIGILYPPHCAVRQLFLPSALYAAAQTDTRAGDPMQTTQLSRVMKWRQEACRSCLWKRCDLEGVCLIYAPPGCSLPFSRLVCPLSEGDWSWESRQEQLSTNSAGMSEKRGTAPRGSD